MRFATINLDGNRTSTGGIKLGKPPGVLDFDIAAADLGATLPITVHLVGLKLANNLVQYTFNWSGNVDIDGQGHMLTAASGVFLAQFSSVPGDQNAIGNVEIDVVPMGSSILATGDWGTKTLFVDQASFYGGYLPATLSSYTTADNSENCSSSTSDTPLPLIAQINSPAPPSGQWVFLTSAYHQGLSLPPIVVIPPNKKIVQFNATVAKDFVGIVHTTATSGGGVATLDVQVDPEQSCQDGGTTITGPPIAFNPDPSCIQCTLFVGFTDFGEKIGIVNGAYVVLAGSLVTPLSTMFAGHHPTAITARSIANSGFITGLITIGGRTTAYRANIDHDPGTLEQLGAITPSSIGLYGTVVGSRALGTSGRTRAALSYGTGVIDVPLPADVYSSTALAISDAGDIIGTYTVSATGAPHGYRSTSNGHVVQLPASAAVPVAINANGQIAANGLDTSGHATAAIVSASNALTLLGNPAGFTGFQIKSMNKFGTVVGVASSVGSGAPISRAFVWSRTRGFRALSGHRPELPLVDDALFITNANTMVVHGTTASGVTNLFVLPL